MNSPSNGMIRDPYEILRVPKNFTLDQLKRNYKLLALQMHPDKNLIDPRHAQPIFQILTESYKKLLDVHESRQFDKPFFELKAQAQAQAQPQAQPQCQPQGQPQGQPQCQPQSQGQPQGQPHTQRHPQGQPQSQGHAQGHLQNQTHNQQPQQRQGPDSRHIPMPPPPAEKVIPTNFLKNDGYFDHDKFNQFFSENKLVDKANEKGYGEWLKMEPRPESSAKKKKGELPPECKSLMLHLDCMPLMRSKLQFSELGVDSIEDFSLTKATDLRVAYSEPEEVKADVRKEYKTISDLEKDRGDIRYTMTDDELIAYERFKSIREKRDIKQQVTLKKMDMRALDNYEKVKHLLTRA